MKSDENNKFVNASRNFMGVFWRLSLIFLMLGVLAVLALLYVRKHTAGKGDGLEAISLLISVLMLPGSVAMLLSAIITIPTARRTDRCYAEFNEGKFLVHWTYLPEQWATHLETETRRLRKISRTVFMMLFGLVAFVGLIGAIAVPGSVGSKILRSAMVLTGSAAVGGCCLGIARRSARRRIARMNAHRETYIGPQSFYSAGDFNFWGGGMRGLQSLRILPGQPSRLELVIGMSRGARRATAVADTINLLNLRPTNASQYTSRHLILIPTGKELEAATVVATLTGRAPSPPVNTPIPMPHGQE